MSEDRNLSGLVQVMLALITVAGSLGVAWITTGAKFEKELKDSQETIGSLRGQVSDLKSKTDPIMDALNKQRDEADKKINDLAQLLKAATDKNTELQQNLAELQSQISTAQTSTQELKNVSLAAKQQILDFRAVRPQLSRTP